MGAEKINPELSSQTLCVQSPLLSASFLTLSEGRRRAPLPHREISSKIFQVNEFRVGLIVIRRVIAYL